MSAARQGREGRISPTSPNAHPPLILPTPPKDAPISYVVRDSACRPPLLLSLVRLATRSSTRGREPSALELEEGDVEPREFADDDARDGPLPREHRVERRARGGGDGVAGEPRRLFGRVDEAEARGGGEAGTDLLGGRSGRV